MGILQGGIAKDERLKPYYNSTEGGPLPFAMGRFQGDMVRPKILSFFGIFNFAYTSLQPFLTFFLKLYVPLGENNSLLPYWIELFDLFADHSLFIEVK